MGESQGNLHRWTRFGVGRSLSSAIRTEGRICLEGISEGE
jgi:hypothetical protein